MQRSLIILQHISVRCPGRRPGCRCADFFPRGGLATRTRGSDMCRRAASHDPAGHGRVRPSNSSVLCDCNDHTHSSFATWGAGVVRPGGCARSDGVDLCVSVGGRRDNRTILFLDGCFIRFRKPITYFSYRYPMVL